MARLDDPQHAAKSDTATVSVRRNPTPHCESESRVSEEATSRTNVLQAALQVPPVEASAKFREVSAIPEAPLTTPKDYRLTFPAVGSKHFGFELVSELGRGSFGRVYLAKQSSLADRLVVLKVGTELSHESERLGQLQHPNIVPVYSFHREGPLQAFSMPYLGPVTLSHVLSRVRDTKLSTLNGKLLSTVLSDCLKSSVAADPATMQVNPLPTGLADFGTSTNQGLSATPFEATVLDKREIPYAESSYIDAVLWIITRVAEGLEAAHKADIIHSDLKPANILLGQQGQPLLIDFGVAFNAAARLNVVKIGGTRPYMSPEQIRSIRDEELKFDHRSDIYSLGMILFELLTTRRPFAEVYQGEKSDVNAELLIRERVPKARSLNKSVSWGLEAILQKCLAFDPDKRYQSAEQLREDLQREQDHLPLKYAANLSRLETVKKFTRRNRWLLALATSVVGGTALAAGLAYHNRSKSDQLASYKTQAQAESFRLAARSALAQLETPARDNAGREAARRAGEQALQLFSQIPTEPIATSLNPRSELAASVLLSMGRSAANQAIATKATPDKAQLLAQAREFTQRAEGVLKPFSTRSVALQLAWLDQLEGHKPAVPTFDPAIPPIQLDFRTDGILLVNQNKLADAKKRFQAATQLDPQDYWSVYHQAVCHYQSGPTEQHLALSLFDSCINMDPSIAGAYFNRGLVLMRLQQFDRAIADFTHIISIRDDWADAYLNRATAREGNKDFFGAIDDFSKALQLGYPPTAVLLSRSRLYTLTGQTELAKKDLDRALNEEPVDERGWLARGVAQLPKPTEKALEKYREPLFCFNKALELNPKSLTALQFIARVYSITQRNQESIDILTEQLKHYPDSVDALSGRAMLYSRLGLREKAHADAERAERLCESSPRTIYQLAGVYAMTSKTNPEDKEHAYRHLAFALRRGYGYEQLDQDRELDPLRAEPQFSRVVEESRRYFAEKK